MTLHNYHQLNYYQKDKQKNHPQNHPKKHGGKLSNLVYNEN